STGQIRISTATGEPVDTIDLSLSDLHHAQPRMIGGMNFTNYPVLITGNTATLCPHLGALKHGQDYRISIDPGVFDGVTNKTTWTIHIRRSGPVAGARRLIVAADGSGDFCTVQGAVDFLKEGSSQPIEIFIRKG